MMLIPSRGTFAPEEALSLQHWLDSLGLAATVVGGYELVNRQMAGSVSSSTADDVVDEVIRKNGKIPAEDYKIIRKASVYNPDADSITLGKYTNGSDSYIAKAGNNSTYFDMGNDWGNIQKRYGLSDIEMFEYFNIPVLDDAIANRKTIRFSHAPRLFRNSFLFEEWEYIKEILHLTDDDLIQKGDFWYVEQ